MSTRRSTPVLTAAIVLGLGLTSVLAACSGGSTPEPSRSPSSGSASASASASAAPTSGSTASAPTDDQTGSADDGTGPGTGNGSGNDSPDTVDWAAVTKQGVAAAGGGTVVSLTGSGDNWTVVVAGPDGSQTQSVVSATLGRVISGPFLSAADAATTAANVARAAALRVDAASAAAAAVSASSGGTLSALVLGGTGTAPVWTATLTGSSSSTVTVDGVTGTAS
jgi:hypothetical protein